MLLQIHEPGETPAPHEGERGFAVGIDLGTTNSVVAVSKDGRPHVLTDARGGALVPSIVAYDEEGDAIVGEMARRMMLAEPETAISSIKRLMGRGLTDLKRLAGALPYRLADGAQDGMVVLEVAGRRMTPVEISADILRALKSRAAMALGGPVERAVITVPAYFDDAARTATRDAARLAGLEVLRLVNEPTAAALAYGLDSAAEGVYAVFDLGGGTFDVSLLRLEKGVFQVLATGGDAALGGDDFDHAIAEHFLRQRGVESLAGADVSPLLHSARLAKECLTEQDKGRWWSEVAGNRVAHDLDRATMDQLISPLVDRAVRIVRDVLDDAGVATADVSGVVLVGGSTRTPLVRAKVAEFFGKQPLADIDPDQVVALGAALQAEALTVGSETLLLDVIPLSLGIETMGGIVEKVIDRNTPIPVAKAQDFTTYQDGQTAMAVHVLQGERETADACRSLGRFVLTGIPAMVAGAARIRVTFAVDADGLLTVAAAEQTTGAAQTITVKPSYGLSDEDMARMLRDSMENAREDMERRLLLEARVEAQRSLEALSAARLRDAALLPQDEAALIDAAADHLRAVLNGDDRDLINLAVEDLEQSAQNFAQRRIDAAFSKAMSGKSIEGLAAGLFPEQVAD
jgi:molecular chaperone HscA